MKKTLWLVRHGATNLNDPDPAKDRIRGWKDIPLNKEGEKEAEDLGKFFEGKGIVKIYSSDLGRAMKTAKTIKSVAGLDQVQIIPTKALRPWNLGELEGKVVKEILPQMLDYAEKPYLKVPDGESYGSFLKRLLPFMRSKLYKSENGTLFVSHYRDLKAVHSWIEDGMKGDTVSPDSAVSGKLKTGAVLEMTNDGGKWKSKFIELK